MNPYAVRWGGPGGLREVQLDEAAEAEDRLLRFSGRHRHLAESVADGFGSAPAGEFDEAAWQDRMTEIFEAQGHEPGLARRMAEGRQGPARRPGQNFVDEMIAAKLAQGHDRTYAEAYAKGRYRSLAEARAAFAPLVEPAGPSPEEVRARQLAEAEAARPRAVPVPLVEPATPVVPESAGAMPRAPWETRASQLMLAGFTFSEATRKARAEGLR